MAKIHMSLNEIAYKIIKEKIIQGEFEPGSRIREDYLAEEIAMSRTPVREAINKLVSDGLIINKARKGLYLIDPTNDEIEQYLDIRIALEKLSVEKCIDIVQEKQIEQISDALDEFEYCLSKQEYKICNQLDGEFHLLIANLSRNFKLYNMLKELSSFFHLTRIREKKEHPQGKNERTLAEHRVILEAIRNKDKIAAASAITHNVGAMRDNLHL